jgi:hypothetical protein
MIKTFGSDHVHLDVLKYLIKLKSGVVYTEWPDLRNFIWQHEEQVDFIKQTIDAVRGSYPLVVNTSIDAHGLNYVTAHVEKYQLQSNCVFLVNEPETHFDYFKFFPQFILRAMSQRRGPCGKENPEVQWTNRTHKLNFLNRTARPHRIYAYYLAAQNSWLSHELTSFGNIDNIYQNEQFIMTAQTHDDLINKAIQYGFYSSDLDDFYAKNIKNFPISPENNEHWFNGNLIYDTGAFSYKESYLSYATESNIEQFFPTEKTTKPLVMGNLLLTLSSQHYMQTLHDLGFDLKYKNLDFSCYDSEPSWHTRCQKATDLVTEVYPHIDDIWHDNLDKLRFNSELFLSDNFADKLLSSVTDFFERTNAN